MNEYVNKKKVRRVWKENCERCSQECWAKEFSFFWEVRYNLSKDYDALTKKMCCFK